MRGLKHQYNQLYKYGEESHLLQMRGLKRQQNDALNQLREVASFTDAWIETPYDKEAKVKIKSHLLQMRGLKPLMLSK